MPFEMWRREESRLTTCRRWTPDNSKESRAVRAGRRAGAGDAGDAGDSEGLRHQGRACERPGLPVPS